MYGPTCPCCDVGKQSAPVFGDTSCVRQVFVVLGCVGLGVAKVPRATFLCLAEVVRRAKLSFAVVLFPSHKRASPFCSNSRRGN